MTEQPTIFLVERHLQTEAATKRSHVFDRNRGYAKIPPYQRIDDAVKSVEGKHISPWKARKIVKSLQQDVEALREFTNDYATLGPDEKVKLMPGEMERGRKIGEKVREYLGGRAINIAAMSPTFRTRMTAEAVLSTADADMKAERVIEPLLRERQNGRAVEAVSYRSIYLARNPRELLKYSWLGKWYRPAEKNAESERQFDLRGVLYAMKMKWSPQYEGKVVYVSTHSEYTGLLRRIFKAPHEYVATGTITAFSAEPRRGLGKLRPRRFAVSAPMDFAPRHKKLENHI